MKSISCEICNLTNDGLNEFIANHIICDKCLKKLKILKNETILKHEILGLELEKKLNLKFKSYKDTILEIRLKHWKRIIYYDILLKKYNNLKDKK